MTIQQWPSADRPRERLLQHGREKLSDSELLALLIQSGTRGNSSVDCARALISKFGNLRSVIDADYKQMTDIAGIGAARYALLQAGAEIGRRYFQQRCMHQGPIVSHSHAKDYFMYTMAHKQIECFYVLFLDSMHHIIQCEELFQGNLTELTIQMRLLVKKCLNYNAVAVIIAHNHPRGRAAPSDGDLKATQMIIQVLHYLNIRLIDHIIVGENSTLSMQEEGFIDNCLPS
jgi:DNA repair protein RadC